jgi:hypothetical protein
MQKNKLITTILMASLAFGNGLVLNACADANKTDDAATMPAASPVAPAQSAKAEIQPKSPDGWYVIDEKQFIPVLDDLGRHMLAARESFLNKDNKAAATHVREGAAFLTNEESKAREEDREKLKSAVADLNNLAAGLDKDAVKNVRQIDAAYANAHQADMERLWVVADERIWVPYIQEPDSHFRRAHENFLKKDYRAAATEIRKAVAYVKLESARAATDSKKALNASAQELEALAKEVEKGAVKDVKRLDDAFARADQALAKSHYVKASESWTKKLADKTGYELKAASESLEKAASWAGSEASSAASTAMRDGRKVAGKLISGTGWAVDEVGKAIDAVGQKIEEIGKKVTPPAS